MAGEAGGKGESGAYETVSWQYGGQTKDHIWQRIVEEYLQWMQEERVLHHVDDTIQETAQAADARTIAVGYEKQRNHSATGDAAALRHMIEAQLVQNQAERQHECDIDQGPCRELHMLYV